MSTTRPLILISNDDGYRSVGIDALFRALAPFADVIMVAPETEQSASSHALSLHRPLRLHPVGPNRFALDGTPADCVYVALHAGTRLLPKSPDLVVSGINHGLNLGQDAFYSGTVGAAREGALRGIPSIAASTHASADFDSVAELVAKIARELLARPKTAAPTLLNVNVPKVWTGEVRTTRMGTRIYEELVDFRKDPRGKEYLWIGGPRATHENMPGTDTAAYDEGVATVTPMVLDLTSMADLTLASSIVAAAMAR